MEDNKMEKTDNYDGKAARGRMFDALTRDMPDLNSLIESTIQPFTPKAETEGGSEKGAFSYDGERYEFIDEEITPFGKRKRILRVDGPEDKYVISVDDGRIKGQKQKHYQALDEVKNDPNSPYYKVYQALKENELI